MNESRELEPEIDLPHHVAASVESLLALQRRHEDDVRPTQRFIESITRFLSRARAAGGAIGARGLWITANAILAALHRSAPDPPPFEWLNVFASIAALLMTFFILATENRLGVREDRRAQLNLQLALLTETKVAKLIELIEQLRHDDPSLRDRIDPDAIAMTQPADPHAVVNELERHDPRDV